MVEEIPIIPQRSKESFRPLTNFFLCQATAPERMKKTDGTIRNFDDVPDDPHSSPTMSRTSRLIPTSRTRISDQRMEKSTQDLSDSDEENHENKTIDDSKTSFNHRSLVWQYMEKEQGEKARCKLCATILTRTNCGTTGLRKHLLQVHKLRQFAMCPTRKRPKANQISVERKKQLDALTIRCIIEDGRSFGDMRRLGLLKVFNSLAPGKRIRM